MKKFRASRTLSLVTSLCLCLASKSIFASEKKENQKQTLRFLDGKWLQSDIYCSNGLETEVLKEARKTLKTEKSYFQAKNGRGISVEHSTGLHFAHRCVESTNVIFSFNLKGEVVWKYQFEGATLSPNNNTCATPEIVKSETYKMTLKDNKLVGIFTSDINVTRSLCTSGDAVVTWSPATDADIPKHEIICQEKYDQLMAGKPVNDCACNEKKSECQIPKEEINDIFNKPKKK